MSPPTPTPGVQAPGFRMEPYRTLEAWRGFASLWVVMFHAAHATFVRYPDLRYARIYAFSAFGSLGVQLFFVISGYCIATAACNVLPRERGFQRFLRARLRRIYPTYWSAWLTAAASTVFAGLAAKALHLGSSYSAANDVLRQPAPYWLSNVTLTQVLTHHLSLISPTWTLCYEMGFYLVVALLISVPFLVREPRSFLNALHGLTVAALLVLTLAPQYQFYPLDLWPQFGLGVVIYDIARHPGEKRPRLWMLLVSALFLTFALRYDLPAGPEHASSRLTFTAALTFGMLLLLLYRFDAALSRLKVVRAFSRIGLFSYSLYLIHMLVIGIVNQIVHLAEFPERLHLIPFSVTVLVAVAAGGIFYRFFERPFVKPVFQPPARPGSPAGAVAHTAE